MLWLLNLAFALKIIRHRRFTVIYKSGAKVHCKAKRMSFNRKNGVTTFEWDGLRPEVLLFGIDDVAAVWTGWK